MVEMLVAVVVVVDPHSRPRGPVRSFSSLLLGRWA